ncbi:MAG TPA: PhnD/SsuA/transferrin family substrate-binding protein [Dissulfurispiraceae bacterium]|nr:PhnD/SsuA/transferrin family substrate-binding protein [Dissulfurispiraceae bacterium]
MKYTRRLVLGALSLVFLFFITGTCSPEVNEYMPHHLRVGYSAKFLNDVSLADAQVAIELWTKEMAKSSILKVQPKAFIFDNLQTMVTALQNNEIDMVTLTAMDFIKIRDKVAIEPALVASRRGAAGGDELALIVRRDQGITDVKQLKGKKVMVHAYMLDSAYIWLSNVVHHKKQPLKDKFFGSVQEVKKASQAVLPVFFKQADAVVVSKNAFETMSELNPQLAREMMIIHSSEKLMYGMICMNTHLSPTIKKDIMNSAVSMHRSPAGRQILTLFQIDNITAYKPSMLFATMALLNRYAPEDGSGL